MGKTLVRSSYGAFEKHRALGSHCRGSYGRFLAQKRSCQHFLQYFAPVNEYKENFNQRRKSLLNDGSGKRLLDELSAKAVSEVRMWRKCQDI